MSMVRDVRCPLSVVRCWSLALLLTTDSVYRFSGFFSVIKGNGGRTENLIRFMALSGNQYRITAPGHADSQLDCVPPIRLDRIALFVKSAL